MIEVPGCQRQYQFLAPCCKLVKFASHGAIMSNVKQMHVKTLAGCDEA